MRNVLDLLYLFAFSRIWNTYAIIFIIGTYCHMSTFSTYSLNSSVIKSLQYTIQIHWVDCVQESAKVRSLGQQTTECTLNNDTGAFQFAQVIARGWVDREFCMKIRYKKYHFYIVHSLYISAVLIYKPLIINLICVWPCIVNVGE